MLLHDMNEVFLLVKKKKKKSRVPLRINILFFIVFFMFSILVVQLGVIQILQGESLQDEINKTVQDTSKEPVPRGKIYDRNFNLVVDNDAKYAITYTPPKRVQAHHKLELAEKLVQFMEMDEKHLNRITMRNKQEYWYLKNTEAAQERVTEEERDKIKEKYKEKREANAKIYQLEIDQITEEDFTDYTDEDMQIIAIKRELDKAYKLTPQVIKNENVSGKEFAQIAEHLNDLQGINVTTDWDRKFVYGDTLRPIIGSITSQEQGIPEDKEDFYLSRGYSRNDRVGRSGLEQQYEDVLKGRKKQSKHTTTQRGSIIDSEVIVEGERGKDLVLSTDMEFQQYIDDLLEKEMKNARDAYPVDNKYLTDAQIVVMEPKTGEILALSAIQYDHETERYKNEPFRTLYDAHRPGSTIKGATVLAGLGSGVIRPGQVFYDSPIQMKDTPIIRSYTTGLGSLNDIAAIQRSSNIYMSYIGLRMLGDNREPFPQGGSPPNRPTEAITKFRYYFKQFGLGAETGIDFPYEETGFEGNPNAGNILHYSFGQFDTYTVLQLAQYVSTIANDGYRVQPKLVKSIHEPAEGELGNVYRANDTKILNKVSMDDDHIKRVQEGFWKVFNEPGGTAYSRWQGKPYKPAGKTGTVEDELYIDGKKIDDTQHLALVGYAPFDDPEVAFAVITTHLRTSQYPIQHRIAEQVLDTYFEKKDNPDKSINELHETDEEEDEAD